mmetsp:Transcript_1411/g.2975  ORF Transcript_1411/g.2975 Transcript_1411/m.2975 type:complete len:663 (+) Transcript_1411:144-2132(+)
MRNIDSAPEFFMHDVDISRNHGHGTVPVPGRESHTADLKEFDRYVEIMKQADRQDQDSQWDVEGDASNGDEGSTDHGGVSPYMGMDINMNDVTFEGGVENIVGDLSSNNDHEFSEASRLGLAEQCIFIHKDKSKRTQYPFNSKFWTYFRSILSNAKPVGFYELSNPNAAALKGPDEASNFLGKLRAISPINPIQPAAIAKEGGFNEDEVLAELFYGTVVGLVAMIFAPECVKCGSAVMDTDIMGRVPSKASCRGCNEPNVIESLDKIKVMFLLNSDVLYILAENYACTPSAESMSHTAAIAAVPANSTGSGYSYCVGTGNDTEIAPALDPGKYRMHCPIAKTDNYLVVEREAGDKDRAVKLRIKVSDLVCSYKKGKQKAVLYAPHGRIQFDVFSDTNSLFILWVQKDKDDKMLIHLPDEERALFTTAARVIHHPIFNALFQDNRATLQRNVVLSISNVVLVFTDIVDSTKLYASLGDGKAFTLVRKHFQVLFGAFTRNGGRVVKTIGDAVMASFTSGRAALMAVSEAMELLPTVGRRPDNNSFLEIRIGIHSGQAMIVPLNGVNDYFGQTANIAARVQSAAKASECFVTETVLESSEDAREAYTEITRLGSSFKATPLAELNLKGVAGKVHARGFRWLLRSRRASELSSSFTSYMDRRANRG